MNKDSHPRYVNYVLIVGAAALLLLCLSFYDEFNDLRRLEILQSRQGLISSIKTRAPLTENDVSLIESWMTFDYINKVFKLSPDFFTQSLKVSDIQYPRLTLRSYAKRHSQDANTFTNSVRSAVQAYFSNASSSKK